MLNWIELEVCTEWAKMTLQLSRMVKKINILDDDVDDFEEHVFFPDTNTDFDWKVPIRHL